MDSSSRISPSGNNKSHLIDSFNTAIRQAAESDSKLSVCVDLHGDFSARRLKPIGGNAHQLTTAEIGKISETFSQSGSIVDSEALARLANKKDRNPRKFTRKKGADKSVSDFVQGVLKLITARASSETIESVREDLYAGALPSGDSEERLKRANQSFDNLSEVTSQMKGSRRASQALRNQIQTLAFVEIQARLVADQLTFEAPFSRVHKPYLICEDLGSIPDNHPAIITPRAEPFKSVQHTENGEAVGMLICKGYLKPGEFCGDYIATRHYDTHSVSVVIDSAGNEKGCYLGAKILANQLADGLTDLVGKYGSNTEQMKSELSRLIAKLYLTASINLKKKNGNHATAAFAIRINNESGKQLLLGGTVGDARILYLHGRERRIKNMSRSNFNAPYSDPGGSLGGNLPSKLEEGQHPIQLFTCMMEPGDMVILGSDGMGDNLEPKTVGLTPKQAFDLLQTHKRAPEIDIDPALLSDELSVWHEKNPPQAETLQSIHDAFIGLRAETVLGETEHPVETLFDYCVNSVPVKWGVDRAFLDDQTIQARGMRVDHRVIADELIHIGNKKKRLALEIQNKLEIPDEEIVPLLKEHDAYIERLQSKDEKVLRDAIREPDPLEGFIFYRHAKPDDVGITSLSARK